VTEHQGSALRIALAYYDAWASKDLERTMSFIAHDIVCDAPAGRIEGVPVPSAPCAADFTVADNKITGVRFIFDRVPYEAAARQRQTL
jgi:ketosteroid isomerase-like protein